MKKVLCERPRAHGLYSYKDFRQRENRGDFDDLPSHQGIRRPYDKGWCNKELTDLIGPLRSFLHGSVGRRWDDVWSEICEAVGSGNTVDQHLRDHAVREVETHTFLGEDGEVLSYGFRGGSAYPPWGLYVDPRDGLVYYNERKSYRAPKQTVVDGIRYEYDDNGLLYPTSRNSYPLKLIGDQKAMLIDRIWYWIEMAETPPPRDVEYLDDAGRTRSRRVFSPRYDLVRREHVQQGRYHSGKRQMASRDLRLNGLRNIR